MKTQQFDDIVAQIGTDAENLEISPVQDTVAKANRRGNCPFTLEPFAGCSIRNKNKGGQACPYSLEACLKQDPGHHYY